MIDDRHQRVLIVDDDPSIRRMLAASLKKEGYRTADACDGREALEVMRAGQAEVVSTMRLSPLKTISFSAGALTCAATAGLIVIKNRKAVTRTEQCHRKSDTAQARRRRRFRNVADEQNGSIMS